MIRVLVVDDSALMRKMISQILTSDPEIEVVDTAMDGLFALDKIEKYRPDVIALDIDMPRMNGIETLTRIMEEHGIPTIIVSSLAKKNAEVTLKALELGAFDAVMKPQDAISVHIKDIASDLISAVKAAHRSPVAKLGIRKHARPQKPLEKKAAPAAEPASQVLAIGISTGGPNALSFLLPTLPKEFPAGILIVQHMPAGFTAMFASRLNAICQIEVREAHEGDLILAGRALIAPGDRHLKIKRLPLGTIAVLSDAAPVNGHKPSADVLFNSVAAEYGARATGLIMTGMGNDGAKGMAEIRQRGGFTAAQDEKSCVVFGMPKTAIEHGAIMQVIPLEEIPAFLIERFSAKEEYYGTVIS